MTNFTPDYIDFLLFIIFIILSYRICHFRTSKNLSHMKKVSLSILILLFQVMIMQAQNVNGLILSDTANLRVMKVWGTHYERGFAYGYLSGDKILDMYENYFMLNYGGYMSTAHDVVQSGLFMKIDSNYVSEAKGILAGMDSAGYDVDSIDHYDLLASNCLLDLLNALKMKGDNPMGCSSLMSWGIATLGTDLQGHSAITRHLDWSNDAALLRNQVLIAHLPSESDEQAWAFIGFAGQFSALSGFNMHFGTFQHMMSDFSGSPSIGNLYEPVWFALRRALETRDANGDGQDDAADVKAVLSSNTSGFADGYIICSMGKSSAGSPEKIAEIAEVAPVAPFLTFRSNTFPDSIVGDNLYAANYEIRRNNHYHFCSRYYGAITGIGDGETIGSAQNWNIMRDHSVSLNPMGNIQMMQYIPEENIFRLSVQKNGQAAYENLPDTFLISSLLTHPAGISAIPAALSLKLWPNPAGEKIFLSAQIREKGMISYRVTDLWGKIVLQGETLATGSGTFTSELNTSGFAPGLYTVSMSGPGGHAMGKFVILP